MEVGTGPKHSVMLLVGYRWGGPQRHSWQRCHHPRVLPLLLLQPPSCYRKRRGKIMCKNPIPWL
jgi:hypothetical protein